MRDSFSLRVGVNFYVLEPLIFRFLFEFHACAQALPARYEADFVSGLSCTVVPVSV